MPAVFARSQNNKDAHPLPLSHRREGPTGSSPSSRSPSPYLARRGKREGTETRSWRGRDSLCPCLAVHAKPPSRPRTLATRTLPCPTLSARVTSPWPRRSMHRVSATLTPPTADEIRFGITKSNHASSDRPSPAKAASRPSMSPDLPSHHPPRHGQARSIKLHPMPNPSPFHPVRRRLSGTQHAPHRQKRREGEREEQGGAGARRTAKKLVGARRERRSTTST
jgi:hypothetical protein